MDVKIGDQEAKRIVFELFENKTPITSENFRALCTGEKETDGNKLHYKGNIFHRVINNFMAQGGDITNMNGTGGMSIYGGKFNDEKIWIPHTHGGLLSMANSGENTNGSQFFITFAKAAWLDGKHTVFGRVIKGFEHVKDIEKVETGANDKPLKEVKIVECGQIKEGISEDDLELERYGVVDNIEVAEENKREI